MPARLRNFIIDPGADFVRVLAIADSAGDPLDMTGGGYSARLRILNDDGTELLVLSSATDAVVLGNGTITIDSDKAVADALDLAGLARRGTITEPAPPLEGSTEPQPDYVAFGTLADCEFYLTEPGDLDSRLLKGLVCFASR